MYQHRDIKAASYCKLPKRFCKSKSLVNIQNTDNYCSLWCILAQKYKVDNHRERVSNYAIPFDELNQNDIPFLMKIKDISI